MCICRASPASAIVDYDGGGYSARDRPVAASRDSAGNGLPLVEVHPSHRAHPRARARPAKRSPLLGLRASGGGDLLVQSFRMVGAPCLGGGGRDGCGRLGGDVGIATRLLRRKSRGVVAGHSERRGFAFSRNWDAATGGASRQESSAFSILAVIVGLPAGKSDGRPVVARPCLLPGLRCSDR